MAFAFPLSQAQFLDQLRVQSARFWLPESLTMESTEGGEIFTADRGPRLWQAEFTLAQGHHHTVDESEARLALLAQAGRSFLAYDPRRTGPKADPEGAALAGFTPKISTTTAREVTLSGLPAGYQISRGDYLGWTYGSNPVRYALHRAVTAPVADGTGLAVVEVIPNIRPGTTAGTTVTLLRPVCKMVLVPGSYEPGQAARVFTAGATFRAQQTLR
jgi:hypothetical protein